MSQHVSGYFSQPALTAGGNVSPSRFVKMSAVNTGIQCSSQGELAIGCSDNFTDRFPNDQTSTPYIAVSGRALPYKIPGQICDVTLGDTVTAGALLMTDTAGKAIPAVASQAGVYVLGRALVGGVLDEAVPVQLLAPYQLQVATNA